MNIGFWHVVYLLCICVCLRSSVLAQGTRHVYVGCDSDQRRMIFEEFQVANETIQTAEHILSGFHKSKPENHMAHVYLKAFASQTKPISETRKKFASYYRRLVHQLNGTKDSHVEPAVVTHVCNNLHPTCSTNFKIADEPPESDNEFSINLTYCDSWFDNITHPPAYDSYESLSTNQICATKRYIVDLQTFKVGELLNALMSEPQGNSPLGGLDIAKGVHDCISLARGTLLNQATVEYCSGKCRPSLAFQNSDTPALVALGLRYQRKCNKPIKPNIAFKCSKKGDRSARMTKMLCDQSCPWQCEKVSRASPRIYKGWQKAQQEPAMYQCSCPDSDSAVEHNKHG